MTQSEEHTRRRSYGEHPLAVVANLSWVLWGLFTLALVPIHALPDSFWALSTVWALASLALTVFVLRRCRIAALHERREPRSGAETEAGEVRGTSLFRDAMRRLRENQFAVVSVGVLVVIVLLCCGQQVVYWTFQESSAALDAESFFSLHFDYTRINKEESFAPPSVRHWFGTDSLGRDVFSRTLYGGTISFLVAVVATAVSLIIGVSWGAIAGYFGGRVDHYMMRLVDVLYGLPFLFLVILILTLVNGLQTTASRNRDAIESIAALESEGKVEEARRLAAEREITDDVRIAVWLADRVDTLVAMFFALGMVSWLTMARITRGQVLSLREREFIAAARTIGAGNARIIFVHIVPNLLGTVIVYTTLTIPTVMLAEAFLSFIGLGISQPQCSWGSLASEGLAGINVIKPYWWLLVYPAAAIFVTLFSLNFIGDGLRDALDPRAKR